MALWTRDDVRLLAAEMSVANGVSDGTVDAYISIADQQIDSRVFGDSTKTAGSYLTAHLLKSDGFGASGGGGAGGLAAGAIASITSGPVSVTYAQNAKGSGVAAELARTRYGIAYSRLVSLQCVGGLTI